MSLFDTAKQEELLGLSDLLRNNSGDRWGLLRLNTTLTRLIPWNTGHGFRIAKLEEGYGEITADNSRLNQNHVGGLHACALATLGEYCAGLTLMYTFDSREYRLLLTKLEVEYLRQARKETVASCVIDVDSLKPALEPSLSKGSAKVTLTTTLRNLESGLDRGEGRILSNVTTEWQLKRWKSASA